MTTDNDDVYWMNQALQQAQKAFDAGEVPVGAVIVYAGECVAASHNAPIGEHDPSAHAEVRALRQAGQSLGNYRLQGCTVYVTLEPCAMCAMALLHARVDRVVFGARDDKTGAAGSVLDLFAMRQLNHQTQMTGGVLAQECAALLKQFFAQRRQGKNFPLRDDALRTPEERFLEADVSCEGNYRNDLLALEGLRLHYGWREGTKKTLVVCLHDLEGYSEQFAEVMPRWNRSGCAVLAPDLIGFGRSDKPKKARKHTVQFHAAYLAELVQDVVGDRYRDVILIAADSSAVLLCAFLKQCQALGIAIRGVYVVDALPALSVQQREAPFPDRGHRCAPKAVLAWQDVEERENVGDIMSQNPQCSIRRLAGLDDLPELMFESM